MKVNFFFVRHGETNYNQQGLCNSSGKEVFLSNKGISQALDLKKYLEENKIFFDRIIISPSYRVKETLNLLDLSYCNSITEDLRVNELSTQYAGKPIKEYLQLIGDPISGKLNGGESILDLEIRIRSFLKYLFALKDPSKPLNVLIITHGTIIKLVKIINQNLEIESFNNIEIPKNCELFLITKDL